MNLCCSSLTLTVVLLLFVLNPIKSIHPDYFRDEHPERWNSFVEHFNKHLIDNPNNNELDFGSTDKISSNDDEQQDENEQFFKRNKYTNFHLSPLWLSRRTRTNRIYGKPLWISRTG